MLENQNMPLDAQFFAAQTLHTKLQLDFDQLPAEQHANMRSTCISFVTAFRASSPAMRGQIALALAALVIQVEQFPVSFFCSGLSTLHRFGSTQAGSRRLVNSLLNWRRMPQQLFCLIFCAKFRVK